MSLSPFRAAALPFRFERFRFALRLSAAGGFPAYKGALLRGAFGNALKRVMCVRPGADCDGCLLRLQCIYRLSFEPEPPPGFPLAGKFGNAPAPYVLNPPLTSRREFRAGERLEFELVAVGRAVELFPYFLYAFVELGRKGLGPQRGRFGVVRVDLVRNGGTTLLYDGATERLYALPPPEPDPLGLVAPTANPAPCLAERRDCRAAAGGQPESSSLAGSTARPGQIVSAASGVRCARPDFPDFRQPSPDIAAGGAPPDHSCVPPDAMALPAGAAWPGECSAPISDSTVQLEFVTPLRLKERGKLVTQLTFPLLFERLAQRLALLSAFYGENGAPTDLDSLAARLALFSPVAAGSVPLSNPKALLPNFATLCEPAKQVRTEADHLGWFDWERYSSRQKTEMKLGGLIGTSPSPAPFYLFSPGCGWRKR